MTLPQPSAHLIRCYDIVGPLTGEIAAGSRLCHGDRDAGFARDGVRPPALPLFCKLNAVVIESISTTIG